MLPAVVKLCCGISYPHLRNMAGLQRAAVAVIGQEISHLHRARGAVQQHLQTHAVLCHKDANISEALPSREDPWFYQQQGRDAMEKALGMLQDRDGWKKEITESNGDVVCSKVLRGNKKVFRLEAVLDASVDELYDVLFLRVEEMHQWNPSVQQIRVLHRLSPETILTHEVSSETAAGNLIGQRDFLSVRHSCKRQTAVYLGGAAIELEAFPPQSGFVRGEDGPTCIVLEPLEESPNRSKLTWLLNMDVKGWLPKSLVNQALPRSQLDFTRNLRRHLSAGGALRDR